MKNVESVKLLKTLKAGKDVWVEGTVFPNESCPQIPAPILGEALAQRPTVEILSTSDPEQQEPLVFKPRYLDEETQTTSNVTTDAKTGGVQKPVLNQSPEPKMHKIDVPKEPEQAKKSLLQRRK